MNQMNDNKGFARWFHSCKAETLAEVLIALTVLAVGAGGASTLVVTAIRANVQGEERIVAYNFAREGVEAIRNVRDTNWLRFPGNRSECWDTLNAVNSTDCATSTKLGQNTYLVFLETDPTTDALFKWQVIQEDPASADELLYENTIGSGMLYTHDPVGTVTPYHRTVTITQKTTTSMVVESKVWWDSRGRTLSVTFMDELSNY
ncbi:MAG: hypothetical protein ACD_28C00230G0004 [uncultured bacterium]|nr:MAG: hypothetical protein ACD_28C00230G0004 [uncultured bacterium]KKT74703.1 MAG: hypothetical protein UW70_C0047G0004 [Candidatus Peregrinibacteria bacterium GW2011_GWA2_44_7]